MALFDFLSDNWPLVLAPLLGLVSVYALLPRPKRPPVLMGIGAGAAALLLTGLLIVRVGGLTIETCLFYLFSATAVLSGTLLITQTNPARAALSFALVILATCGLFLLQAGPFLMAATIIVYAGAIIVTFLFVIMLAQQQGLSDADARSREPFLSALTGFLLLCALLYILKVTYKPGLDSWVERSEEKLKEIEKMREKSHPSEGEVKALLTDLEQFCSSYLRWWRNEWLRPNSEDKKREPKRPPLHGEQLEKKLFNAQNSVVEKEVDLKKIEDAFRTVYEVGRVRAHSQKMSELSGPSSQHPSADLRRDEEGRPLLPAENTAYLGRSLFTDYLLAVELAGLLLLVATIGAIAIAQRYGAHKPGPAANGSTPRRTA
jgi:NADH-quinone oxidoreductase subunit J